VCCLLLAYGHSLKLSLYRALAEAALALQEPSPTSPYDLTLVVCVPDASQRLKETTSNAYPCVLEAKDGHELPPLDMLFTTLRTFGPIQTLRNEIFIGVSVKFWTEADSLVAQKAGITVDGRRVTLRACDPKSVVCWVSHVLNIFFVYIWSEYFLVEVCHT
jgi:hypothetical protein